MSIFRRSTQRCVCTMEYCRAQLLPPQFVLEWHVRCQDLSICCEYHSKKRKKKKKRTMSDDLSLTNFKEGHNFCAAGKLVNDIAQEEWHQANIPSNKRYAVELWSECVVTLTKDNQNTQGACKNVRERISERAERKFADITALFDVCTSEAPVHKWDTPPRDETCDCCDAQKPLKGSWCTVNGYEDTCKADNGG